MKTIRISQIIVTERSRIWKQIDQDRLTVDIAECGQVMPITVRAIPRTGWLWFLYTQMYQLSDGYLRLKAMESLGYKYINVYISQFKGDISELLINRQANDLP